MLSGWHYNKQPFTLPEKRKLLNIYVTFTFSSLDSPLVSLNLIKRLHQDVISSLAICCAEITSLVKKVVENFLFWTTDNLSAKRNKSR